MSRRWEAFRKWPPHHWHTKKCSSNALLSFLLFKLPGLGHGEKNHEKWQSLSMGGDGLGTKAELMLENSLALLAMDTQSWAHSLGFPGCSRSESCEASKHVPDCQNLSKSAPATQSAGETGTSLEHPLLPSPQQQGINKDIFLPWCRNPTATLNSANESWGQPLAHHHQKPSPDTLVSGMGLAGFCVHLWDWSPQNWAVYWLPIMANMALNHCAQTSPQPHLLLFSPSMSLLQPQWPPYISTNSHQACDQF